MEGLTFLSLWTGLTGLYLIWRGLTTDRPGVMIWVYAAAFLWATLGLVAVR